MWGVSPKSGLPGRHRITALSAALFLGATACGGGPAPSSEATFASSDDAAMTEPAAMPSAEEPTPEPASTDSGDAQPPLGEMGSFSVNGIEYAVTLLNRCIPDPDEPGNLDLQPIAQGAGAQLNLYLTGDFVDVSVQGRGIEEEFGRLAFGDDPVVQTSSVSGDRWTGSATVGDSLGSGTTVDIEWDVMIPPEIRDCSL